jgi:hypothetical protein
MNDVEEAINFGRQILRVEVIKWNYN